MKLPASGGGWRAVAYTVGVANRLGWGRVWRAMRTGNACKTCALGMGGQKGGMVNEAGSFPEVCKKSLQAMAADMQGAIKPEFWSTYSTAQLQAFSPRELESCGRIVQPVILSAGEQYFRPLPWEDAIDRIVARLKSTQP